MLNLFLYSSAFRYIMCNTFKKMTPNDYKYYSLVGRFRFSIGLEYF